MKIYRRPRGPRETLKKKKQTNSSQLNSSEKNLIKMTEFLGRLCVSGATRVGICDRLFSGFGTKAIQQQSVRLAHSRGAMRMYSVLDKKLNTKMQPCLKNSSLLIGQVLPAKTIYQEASGFDPGALTKKQKVVDIRVPYYVYDEYFKAFFEHEWDFLASDGSELCKSGDTVLMRRLEDAAETSESAFLQYLAERQFWKEDDKKKPRAVTFEILEVIYHLGEVVDPLTQKPVVAEKYVDQIEREGQLYGKYPQATFDYKKAPPRGGQEGVRDFTGRRTYKKWHTFKKNDRYGTQ